MRLPASDMGTHFPDLPVRCLSTRFRSVSEGQLGGSTARPSASFADNLKITS